MCQKDAHGMANNVDLDQTICQHLCIGILRVILALKDVSHAIYSHALSGTNPCINKAIHMLLIYGFAVLRISILDGYKIWRHHH